ncbi:hypothetical protein ACFYKX_11470 [Cytobacillus sp. FJAT-54145]|uniref:Uncharacterized protein n=1 Tax=Cytobacillus spartinae TaxID=3299023 RepID=A0ABW6KAH2_9BACI
MKLLDVERGPYGGTRIDVSTLDVGTTFYVCNGAWNGEIVEENGVKKLSIEGDLRDLPSSYFLDISDIRTKDAPDSPAPLEVKILVSRLVNLFFNYEMEAFSELLSKVYRDYDPIDADQVAVTTNMYIQRTIRERAELSLASKEA